MGEISHVSKVAIQESRSEANEVRDRSIYHAEHVMKVAADHVDGIFFIANRPWRVQAIRVVQATAGTDAGAQGYNIEKLTGTQAPSAGVNLLAADVDMKTEVANTVTSKGLTATAADLELAVGDRLAFDRNEAATTGLTNSVISVALIPV